MRVISDMIRVKNAGKLKKEDTIAPMHLTDNKGLDLACAWRFTEIVF